MVTPPQKNTCLIPQKKHKMSTLSEKTTRKRELFLHRFPSFFNPKNQIITHILHIPTFFKKTTAVSHWPSASILSFFCLQQFLQLTFSRSRHGTETSTAGAKDFVDLPIIFQHPPLNAWQMTRLAFHQTIKVI